MAIYASPGFQAFRKHFEFCSELTSHWGRLREHNPQRMDQVSSKICFLRRWTWLSLPALAGQQISTATWEEAEGRHYACKTDSNMAVTIVKHTTLSLVLRGFIKSGETTTSRMQNHFLSVHKCLGFFYLFSGCISGKKLSLLYNIKNTE